MTRRSDSIPLVLQAAINGAGVGIGRRQLLEAELAAGRLVAPFDFELPDVYAYYFVAPDAPTDQPKLAAFRSWLMTEVARANSDRARVQGRTGHARTLSGGALNSRRTLGRGRMLDPGN